MTIILRGQKGSSLTNAELDGNFQDLDGRLVAVSGALTEITDVDIPALEQALTDGLAGKQDLNSKLTSLSGNSTTGILALSGNNVSSRTIVAGSAAIVVTDGNGTGNPTIDIGTPVVTLSGNQALTNKNIDGNSNTIQNINVASIVGTLPIASGGTNATTAAAARSSLSVLKDPTGLTGIVVKTGSDATSVVSLAVSGTGLSISNANASGGNPTISINSTSASTASTVVARDASGNFSANVITADLNGKASSAATVDNGVYTTGSYSNPSWLTSLAGSKVTSIPNSSLVNSSITINGTTVPLGGSTSVTFDGVVTNTPNTVVKRDASGNFSAGTITAALNGNATSATSALNATNAVNASFSTTQLPGTSDTTIATTEFVTTALSSFSGGGLGVGQTWQNVKALRTSGQDYVNNTSKPIAVAVIVNPGTNTVNGFVNGLNIVQANSTSSANSSIFMIVPVGASYKVTSTAAISSWSELR